MVRVETGSHYRQFALLSRFDCTCFMSVLFSPIFSSWTVVLQYGKCDLGFLCVGTVHACSHAVLCLTKWSYMYFWFEIRSQWLSERPVLIYLCQRSLFFILIPCNRSHLFGSGGCVLFSFFITGHLALILTLMFVAFSQMTALFVHSGTCYDQPPQWKTTREAVSEGRWSFANFVI